MAIVGKQYSGRENTELETSVDRHVRSFIDLIRRKYISTDSRVIPMDLSKKVQYLTLDIISTIGLGRPFGMILADADVDAYIQSSEEGLLIGNAFMAIGLGWLCQAAVIGRFLAPSPTDKSGFGKMLGLCYKWVDERWATHTTDKRNDMLASFIRHGMTKDEVKSEAIEQIVAGSDTTASALRGVLLYLMTNPRVYAKLRREIDEAISQDKAPSSSEGIISNTAVKQLPYLAAVIREGIRVWPPVVNLFPHDVPPEGDTIVVDGREYYLPGGTEIGHSVQGMHHSREIFGDDAKAFRPERWLEEKDNERLTRMIKTSDLIFSHGRWMCLGKGIAQLELGKTIFEVLRNFDLAPLNPTNPWTARSPLGLFLVNDQWVIVTEREEA